MFYIERHYLSHSLQLADALIAATAITNGLLLLTGNDKHYKVIKELSITKFKPSLLKSTSNNTSSNTFSCGILNFTRALRLVLLIDSRQA